jgi:hypothetical protein
MSGGRGGVNVEFCNENNQHDDEKPDSKYVNIKDRNTEPIGIYIKQGYDRIIEQNAAE